MHPALVKALISGALALGTYVLTKKAVDDERRSQTLQRAFERFDERIRHEQFGERDLLRERRETLQARLKEALESDLRPRLFHQGSYALHTGVKPLSGEFDMDLGLILECRRSKFAGPIAAKKMVRDALRQGSRRVRIRRSCVTVEYTDKEYGDFHVDLAIYVQEPDGQLYLAKGKEHSDEKYIFWEAAAPEELTRMLNSKHSGANLAQFRRCIRYLKVWKQANFETKAPYSIVLTVAAFHWFEPKTDGLLRPQPNDIEAIEALVDSMLGHFAHGGLAVELPVLSDVDLLQGMTASQMRTFGSKLQELHAALSSARNSTDTGAALLTLQGVFGPAFDES